MRYLKCRNCRKIMETLAISRFNWDGSDSRYLVGYTINDNGVICFETDEEWCGYGLIPVNEDEVDNPNDDLMNTIVCPHCGKPIEASTLSIDMPVVVCIWPKGGNDEG